MKDLIFACELGPGERRKSCPETGTEHPQVRGEYSFNPIWMLSRRSEADLPESTRQEMFSLGTRLIAFDMHPKDRISSWLTM